ncbi:hypothetical protein C9374_010591 [Naegleria lovaniensis]|uniref:Uncharacterized protein n=1 Tax=Naegleria lovaniensis TaxID=51637 RepID=A0AA88KJ62_NAELO|nr:uncharacterized protein C9374_010591 [Naegleria lovaniensis]KAG2374572.1 hypothetical protein C9374_010591 [Naegleria lovaniensis]
MNWNEAADSFRAKVLRSGLFDPPVASSLIAQTPNEPSNTTNVWSSSVASSSPQFLFSNIRRPSDQQQHSLSSVSSKPEDMSLRLTPKYEMPHVSTPLKDSFYNRSNTFTLNTDRSTTPEVDHLKNSYLSLRQQEEEQRKKELILEQGKHDLHKTINISPSLIYPNSSSPSTQFLNHSSSKETVIPPSSILSSRNLFGSRLHEPKINNYDNIGLARGRKIELIYERNSPDVELVKQRINEREVKTQTPDFEIDVATQTELFVPSDHQKDSPKRVIKIKDKGTTTNLDEKSKITFPTNDASSTEWINARFKVEDHLFEQQHEPKNSQNELKSTLKSEHAETQTPSPSKKKKKKTKKKKPKSYDLSQFLEEYDLPQPSISSTPISGKVSSGTQSSPQLDNNGTRDELPSQGVPVDSSVSIPINSGESEHAIPLQNETSQLFKEDEDKRLTCGKKASISQEEDLLDEDNAVPIDILRHSPEKVELSLTNTSATGSLFATSPLRNTIGGENSEDTSKTPSAVTASSATTYHSAVQGVMGTGVLSSTFASSTQSNSTSTTLPASTTAPSLPVSTDAGSSTVQYEDETDSDDDTGAGYVGGLNQLSLGDSELTTQSLSNSDFKQHGEDVISRNTTSNTTTSDGTRYSEPSCSHHHAFSSAETQGNELGLPFLNKENTFESENPPCSTSKDEENNERNSVTELEKTCKPTEELQSQQTTEHLITNVWKTESEEDVSNSTTVLVQYYNDEKEEEAIAQLSDESSKHHIVLNGSLPPTVATANESEETINISTQAEVITAMEEPNKGSSDQPILAVGEADLNDNTHPFLDETQHETSKDNQDILETALEPTTSTPITETTEILFQSGMFKGDVENGVPHGKGLYYTKDGTSYDGGWIQGKRNGKGRLEYPDGSVYEGEFLNDMRHGHGHYTTPNYVYEGLWANDKRNGQGMIEYVFGDKYDGCFTNNFPDGKGQYCFCDGSIYTGEFKHGWRHGVGTIQYADGITKYEGEWDCDRRTGNAKIVYLEGVYTGQVKDGRRHGNGSFTYSNGDVYEGHWENDKKHGKGVYYFGSLKSGSYFRGEWKNGVKHCTGVMTSTKYIPMTPPKKGLRPISTSFEEVWHEGQLAQKKLL